MSDQRTKLARAAYTAACKAAAAAGPTSHVDAGEALGLLRAAFQLDGAFCEGEKAAAFADPKLSKLSSMATSGRPAKKPRLGGASGGSRSRSRANPATAQELKQMVETAPVALVGRTLSIYWPENKEWSKGVVTDYNSGEGKTCVTYAFNTPKEEFTWHDLRKEMAKGYVKMLNTSKVDVLKAGNTPAMTGGPVGAAAAPLPAPEILEQEAEALQRKRKMLEEQAQMGDSDLDDSDSDVTDSDSSDEGEG